LSEPGPRDMSDIKGPHEPSMEEILASIRRIIAEDADAPAGDKAAEKVESEATPAATAPPPEEDVLELTEVIEEDAPVTAPQSPAAHEDGPEPVALAEAGDDRLLSNTSAAASVAAMTQLVGRGQRDRSSEMQVGAIDRTLEDVVRELLRPLLRDWLDEHLPQLVERLVKDELERLAREAHGR
jgi:uncharacterized protein